MEFIRGIGAVVAFGVGNLARGKAVRSIERSHGDEDGSSKGNTSLIISILIT